MTNINDSDILITKSDAQVYIDLSCGYGQPSVTTIYLKKNDGTTEKLLAFDGNAGHREVGLVSTLKYNAIVVHTTIHDVRQLQQGREEEDISLKIKVYDSPDNFTDTAFSRKTKGKGSMFHSFYTVTIF
ncbi:MAG: hypothetical protein ACLFPE_01390 [Bacteroidales bacterium]